jgi:hypothetical protein
MTRVLVWKELREQWLVWLAVAAASAGSVAALAAITSPNHNRDEMLVGVLWLAAWGYGLVAGSLLLAGEAEEETQSFLDGLPVTRRRVWRVKAAAGLLLQTAMTVVLIGVLLVAFSQGQWPFRAEVIVTGLLLGGVSGFAWGLYCGSYAATVLGAVARGAVLQAVVAAVLFALVVLTLWTRSGFENIEGYLEWSSFSLVLGLAAAGAAALSRKTYCHSDWLRATRIGASPMEDALPVPTWWESLRLATAQARRFAIGMPILGTAGLATFVIVGVTIWPAATLLIGVLAGATVLSGKDGARPAHVRELYARAVVRFGIGVGSAALTALVPTAIIVIDLATAGRGELQEARRVIEGSVASDLLTQPVLILAFWLVYAYSVGLLCGSFFRSRLAAVAVSLAVAVPFDALWVPAVFSGGPVHAWQTWVCPVVLLAASAWRIHTRTAAASLRGFGVGLAAVLVAGGWQAVALGYRAAEMPLAPDAIDVGDFVASLPTPEQNVGGRLAASALRRLAILENTSGDRFEFLERPAARSRSGGPPSTLSFNGYVQRLEDVVKQGWQADNRRLAAFLDSTFDEVWAKELAESAGHPTGMVVDPRETTLATQFSIAEVRTPHEAAILLVARGLQREAEGDAAVFVDNLRTGLALARSLRHQSGWFPSAISARVETRMLRGVEKWLEGLDGRPDLLRRALGVLRHHGEQPETSADDRRKADFLVALNTFDDVTALPQRGAIGSTGLDPFFPTRAFRDTAVLRICWEAPGEKERRHRILYGLVSTDLQIWQTAERLQSPLLHDVLHFLGLDHHRSSALPEARDRCLMPVTTLQVALRLHQEEKGRPAGTLGDLVPGYLPSVPLDPFDGRPFRYRLSKGETLDWPTELVAGAMAGGAGSLQPQSSRAVSAGQGVLWSVGEDGRDDGGHVQAGSGAFRTSSEFQKKLKATPKGDEIFLVPQPPSRR